MESEARAEAIRRLRSIEGHVRGIERMLEDGHSCVDLVRQMLAVKRALDGVSRILVSNQLRECIMGKATGDERERQQLLTEILEALELAGRP